MAMQSAKEGLPDFDKLWDYNKPAETEKKFRNLLPIAMANDDPSYLGQLLTQIARTEGLQRKFSEAHRTLDQVDRLLSKVDAQTRVRYLLELGRVFNSSGKPSESRLLFLQAWDQAKDSGEDFYAVDAAHMMAIIEPPEQQLDWNHKALDLAEKSESTRARGWKGSLYNNIGWTLFDSQKYAEAREMFEKALKHREEQGKIGEIRIARWCVAKALRFLGRVGESLEAQRALLAEYDGAGEKSGYVYEELGECLLTIGKTDEGAGFFGRAYDELSKDQWLVENEKPRLQRLKELGKKA